MAARKGGKEAVAVAGGKKTVLLGVVGRSR